MEKIIKEEEFNEDVVEPKTHSNSSNLRNSLKLQSRINKALKLLNLIRCRSNAELKRSSEYFKSVMEMKHPNILPIDKIDVDEMEKSVYLVGPYPEYTLRSYLQERKREDQNDKEGKAKSTDEREVIWEQLVSALQYSHNKDICHLDLNPENILIQSNLENEGDVTVQITGWKGKVDRENDDFKNIANGFRPPEGTIYHDDDRDGKKSDMYSLGIIGLLLSGISENEIRKIPKNSCEEHDEYIRKLIENYDLINGMGNQKAGLLLRLTKFHYEDREEITATRQNGLAKTAKKEEGNHEVFPLLDYNVFNPKEIKTSEILVQVEKEKNSNENSRIDQDNLKKSRPHSFQRSLIRSSLSRNSEIENKLKKRVRINLSVIVSS